jgi:glycosyltransferase involved in cell wall biosynthesis
MKILFVSRWFPYPSDNGSKIRIFNLIKHLSLYHELHLISFASEVVGDERLASMKQYCQHVDVAQYRPFQPRRPKALLGYISRRPRSVIDTYNAEMHRLIKQAGLASSFNVVVASQVDMAPYALMLPGVLRIFEEIELTTSYEASIKESQPVQRLRRRLAWKKLSNYVAHLLRSFDGCTVVSAQECKRVLQVAPGYGPISIVPNGVDVAYFSSADFGPPEPDTLIYSGALTYHPNFDAVDFFLREVFPLIQTERPQVKLFITGSLDGVPVERLPVNKNVIFTGYLDDIRPRVAQSWINVVPLREGGGTRLKILEALALGTPVVATHKGVEGLDLAAGQDLLVTDKPVEFATAVLHLLQNPSLRERLSRNGRQTVAARYNWSIIGRQFNDFLETVVAEKGRRKAIESV